MNGFSHFPLKITLNILIPNGLMIEMDVRSDTSLTRIKEDVFEQCSRLPLFGFLKQDRNMYLFTYINKSTSIQEEINDESVTIKHIDPFVSVLRMIEKRGDEHERNFNVQIGKLIGIGLHEFDGLKSPQVNDFRWRMSIIACNVQTDKSDTTWKEWLDYQYPPRVVRHQIDEKIVLPSYLALKLYNQDLTIELRYMKMCQNFKIDPKISANDVILMGLRILAPKISQHQSENPEDKRFILKVCGIEEYLKDDEPLINYSYVQEMVSSNKNPSFIITSVESLQQSFPYFYDSPTDSCKRRPSLSGPRRRKVVLAEKVTQLFSITVNYAGPLIVSTDSSGTFGIKIGLYNGDQELCPSLTSSHVVETNEFCHWEQTIVFDIQIRNIPQMSRLCFMLYEVSSSKSGNRINPLAWVNTTVYNYMNNLKSGSMNLSMWPYQTVIDQYLNPSGTVALNPQQDESVTLTITFDPILEARDIPPDTPVAFSLLAQMNPIFNDGDDDEPIYLKMGETSNEDADDFEPKVRKGSVSKIHLEQLKEVCSKTPVNDVSEQDKELFKVLRSSCCSLLPHALPYVLMSVKWNDKDDVRDMMKLLEEWPLIEPEKALCLLSSSYSALEVRTFAVRCLEGFTDEDLIIFLPQLIQSLKNESFLFNNLAQFLIKRALSNQILGHHLFWLLKSEMSDPTLQIYFGLMLESYCRGTPEHLPVLIKQMECLNQMKRVNDSVRSDASRKNDSREKLKQFLHEMLSQNFFMNSFTEVICPYNPRLNLNKLKIEKCKFMDSKMRPLFMTFSNKDVGAEDVSLIFKVGDDLRQDMLILEILRVMDKIWKEEGLDLRLSPYQVLATGDKVGLIEIVKNSNTIANIQKESALQAFSKSALYKWLKNHNTDSASLKSAVNEFTLSCAGYCVATYILGIADRHSDNIMIKSNGQLFHIDFGHILGKFKEKFGIRRERVPFVLSHDMVHVIKRGNNDHANYKKFENYCESAFMAVRKRGPFIMSIFTLMLATGIPEISDASDLEYLKDTLVLELSDSEALTNFRAKLKEAKEKSWKTSLDWFAHNVTRDNKG